MSRARWDPSRRNFVDEVVHPLCDGPYVVERGDAGAAGARKLHAKVRQIHEGRETNGKALRILRIGDLGMGAADFGQAAET